MERPAIPATSGTPASEATFAKAVRGRPGPPTISDAATLGGDRCLAIDWDGNTSEHRAAEHRAAEHGAAQHRTAFRGAAGAMGRPAVLT